MKRVLATAFALAVLPFSIVWSCTEGRRIWGESSQVFIVQNVGAVVRLANGDVDLYGVTISKVRECPGDGALLAKLQFTYLDEPREILSTVEVDSTGKPVLFTGKRHAGETWTIPHWKIKTPKEVGATAQDIRFVVPCIMPWFGRINTTTNPFSLNPGPKNP
jgi:hypothetical protein